MPDFIQSTGDLAAGSDTANANVLFFKGISLVDTTGDADVVVWKGGDNSGVELARLQASDENQTATLMLPGDTYIQCPEGITYNVTGTSAIANIYYKR